MPLLDTQMKVKKLLTMVTQNKNRKDKNTQQAEFVGCEIGLNVSHSHQNWEGDRRLVKLQEDGRVDK